MHLLGATIRLVRLDLADRPHAGTPEKG